MAFELWILDFLSMLDIKLIRQNPQIVKEACKKRGASVDVDKLLKTDKERLDILKSVEEIRAKKNQANKKIKSSADENEKKKIIGEMKKLDERGDELTRRLKIVEKEFNLQMFQLPNIPLNDVPVGFNESANVIEKETGKIPKFGFKPKDYLEIGEESGIIDVKRASKVSGSRFGYLRAEAALLEFALVRLAFDVLTKEGFTPVVPPVFIKPEMMWGMGYIDTEADRAERYFFEKDNLFLVGTAEQSIGPMHQGEIFQEKDLPKRYVAFSTCFREEAGSYGKDTKGILRVHQFDKLEMFSYSLPQKSKEEHKFLISLEEKLMNMLKLPYRIVHLSTGDTARPLASTFDIETWMPGQNKYRETHSSSNATDFQARRLNIRYKNKKGELGLVHTLNATAFAIGRMIIAILENCQQKNGDVKIPTALKKYLPFTVIKTSKNEK